MLELARYQAGPRGGMILADLGAEVIKIEKPGGEETRRFAPLVNGQSIYFAVYNRGKKSICLDLRQEEGKAIFRDLVKTADFVLENFRPGTIASMGFGYDELRKLKPDIILLSVSGFGQYGPYRERPALDQIGQAMSGLMTLTGQLEGHPIATASSVVDRYTALHVTIGALAALHHRDRTGQGQVVDVCLLDSALTMVEIPTIHYLSTGAEGGGGARPPHRAKDGWVVMAATIDMTRKLIELVGADSSDSQPLGIGLTSSPNAKILAAWCAERTVTEIVSALEELDIPVAPVLSTPQVAEDPHLWEREMLVKVAGAEGLETYAPGLTIKFSESPGEVGPVPKCGQHTVEILGHVLGYDPDRIDRLRARGVVQGEFVPKAR